MLHSPKAAPGEDRTFVRWIHDLPPRDIPCNLPLAAVLPARSYLLTHLRGLHLTQHRRNELGHSRMDRHGALERDVGYARIDHVENAVNGFIAAGSQDRGAQDLVRLGVDDDLHKPFRLALLDRAADPGHRTGADQQRLTRRARLRDGHPDAPQRRIDVERVSRDAVAYPALLAIKPVRSNDLEIVVGGVGESSAPVAIAESPDAGHTGCEALVNRDVAARVGCDASAVETKVLRVRAAPDGEEHMRPD